MAEVRPPSQGRSNSLQRMLDLEKQAMTLRLVASGYTPHSPTMSTDVSRPTSSRNAPHSTEAKIGPTRQVRSNSSLPKPPPLIINSLGHPRLNNPENASTPSPKQLFEPPFVTYITDKPSPKVVAFQFPPDFEDRKSVCQSPTWEAYGRRKREKKEDKREKKEEKRERRSLEQAARPGNPDKPRRLSKPPPVHQNPLAIGYASLGATPASKHQRSRSASTQGRASSDEADLADRPHRTRTGSFTSLLKAFDVRRSSIDQTRESGFIGGIKLEQERHEAHDRAFEAELKAIEAEVHPALRSPNPSSRASSPPRTPTSYDASGDAAKRRAYPPITRQPQPTKQRSSSFSQPTRPDLGPINKLRAFLGGRTSKDGEASATQADEHNGEREPRGAHGSHERSERASRSRSRPTSAILSSELSLPAAWRENDGVLTVEPLKLRTQAEAGRAEPSRTRPEHLRLDQRGLASQGKRPSGKSVGKASPLAPPRRSSKRISPTNSNQSSPTFQATGKSRQVPDLGVVEPPSPHDYFQAFSRPYTPPDLNFSSYDRKSQTPFKVTKEAVSSQLRPRLQSSDDSYSEGSRYSTELSTPNTSSPYLGQVQISSQDKLEMKPNKGPSATVGAPQEIHRRVRASQPAEDLDLARIQAAAKQVLAALPDAMPPSPSSHGALTPKDSGFLPKLKKQAWKSREKMEKVPVGPVPTPPESESEDSSKRAAPKSPRPSRSLPNTLAHSSSAVPEVPPLPKAIADVHPRVAHARSKSTTSSTLPNSGANKPSGDQVAKMFVECCGCKYYHDMPSRLYETMVNPDAVLVAQDSRYAGSLSMTVKCPWCKHEMSTKCCAGLAAMVYIKERLH
jgi:hypothetical protein